MRLGYARLAGGQVMGIVLVCPAGWVGKVGERAGCTFLDNLNRQVGTNSVIVNRAATR